MPRTPLGSNPYSRATVLAFASSIKICSIFLLTAKEITDFSPKSGHSQTGNRTGESEKRINLTITGVGFGSTRGSVWFGDSRGSMASFAKMANDNETHMEWSNTKIVVEVPTTLSDDETTGYKAEYPIFVYPFGSGNDNPLISATTFHCNG